MFGSTLLRFVIDLWSSAGCVIQMGGTTRELTAKYASGWRLSQASHSHIACKHFPNYVRGVHTLGKSSGGFRHQGRQLINPPKINHNTPKKGFVQLQALKTEVEKGPL
eukprot:6484507-Amphidinium_carterae.1